MATMGRSVKLLFILAGVILFSLISSLFFPDVQKYLLKTQLDPWISQADVDYIHITPFSIKVEQLNFKYAAYDIHIGHLDSQFSPFALFTQRIKIDKFIVNNTRINDATAASQEEEQSTLLIPGLFPYLDSGYIIDIGHMDISADYSSALTGPIRLSIKADSVNERNKNPLSLQLTADQLPDDIPDIRKAMLDADIILNQHEQNPIDNEQSVFNVHLVNNEGISQFVKIELAMEQLPLPAVWDSFPFDNRRTHYLKEVLHPESIELKITHKNKHHNTLSTLHYTGEYNGNEGVLSGTVKLLTDKEFLQLFKTLQLPKIQSNLTAAFKYNTRSLEGTINVIDKFTIEDYSDAENKSLPKQVEITNHLIAAIDNEQLQISRFLLDIYNQGHEYIKIVTHIPMSVNLDNPSSFLQQAHSDLLSININQLPLQWFSDFIPDHTIDDGILDTTIKLSIMNSTLKLESEQALSLTQVKVSAENQDTTEPQVLLNQQNLLTDFEINISQEELNAQIKQLDLYQHQDEKKLQQVSTSLSLTLQQPLDKDFINNPLTLDTNGKLNINELIKIPLVHKIINELFPPPTAEELSTTLPQQLAFDYDLSLAGQSSTWSINKAKLNLNSAKNKNIININNTTNIQLKQEKDKLILLSTGSLVSAQISLFDLNWLSPFINQYTKPIQLSGRLDKMDVKISSEKTNEYHVNIEQLKFTHLQAYDDKKLLFKNLNINSKIDSHYSEQKIDITYPLLSIKQNKTLLLKNNGSIILDYPGDEQKQKLSLQGKLKGFVNHLMNVNFVHQLTQSKLTRASVLDADYKIQIKDNKLTINQSDFSVFHPETKGRLDLKTLKPLLFSLQDNSLQNNFSQDGHLRIKLSNFDLQPYETIFPDIPVSLDYANGHFDLRQKANVQKITFKQPLKLHNIHYKDKDNQLLNAFDLTMDFEGSYKKNKAQGKVHEFSVLFLDQQQKALDVTADFKLDLNKKVPLTGLQSSINMALTHWLSQPGIMPQNTLQQGTLNTQITIDKNKAISHKWLISDLTDQQDKKIIKSISINGTGQLQSLSSIKLDMPIVMESLSGSTQLEVKTQLQLLAEKTKLAVSLDGKEVFLNDLFKLLAAINPQSELSKLEASKAEETKAEKTADNIKPEIDNTPAAAPFWPAGIDILTDLNIETLYYSDYMSFHDIIGEMLMNNEQFQAKDVSLLFHDSPMKFNSLIVFHKHQKKPYTIDLTTTLDHFNVGGFLQELEPSHIPKAEGVFDVDIKLFGNVTNLFQIRNELLFDMNITGKDGVYHLIPSDDTLMRSSGHAMAIVGEMVAVLPTSGFGLGIVSRVVRFAKDIQYDFIDLRMSRKNDLNTRINHFRILSPELHFFAEGGLTFQEDTRLFNQPLNMNAQLNLAGEGAAIFYGLGLLKKEQDEYGFWKGPEIKFWGSLHDQQDNFDEVISKAKQGTLLGGITNPFSGLIGNFHYRWFGNKPDYSHFKENQQ